MRRLIWLFLLLFILGCKGDYPWRDEHRGVIKSIGGFEKMIVVEFQDGVAYKIPLIYLSECDPWAVGEEVIVQTRKIGGPSEPFWRFGSINILDPGTGDGLPAEKGANVP